MGEQMAEAGLIRRIIFKTSLICVGLAVGVALAEATVRVYAHATDGWAARQLRADPFKVLVEAHGEWGYRQRPNIKFRYQNGACITSNSLGYRGPQVTIPKTPGTVRIVLLGGSTTHGWGVNDNETIDRYMREELARKYPQRSFEVVNLAFDGYDAYQLFERLRSDGLRFEPDFVIVNTGVNDVRNARFANLQDRDPRTMLWLSEVNRSREEQQRGGPTVWTHVKHYLYLARLPATARGVKQQGEFDEARAITPHTEAMDYFERNLFRIVELVRGTSTVLLFSSEPSSLLTKYRPNDVSGISYWIRDAATTQAYRDSLDRRLQNVVAAARASGARVAHVPYLKLDPSLFLDDAHLTAEGNRRLAQAFVDALDLGVTNAGSR
jgi:lysophospholipase L1-like esterase